MRTVGDHRHFSRVIVVGILASSCSYWVSSPEQMGDSTYFTYTERFGYAAMGAVPRADFFGEIRGVGPGAGVTVYLPPPASAETVMAIAAAAVVAPLWVLEAAAGGDGSVTTDIATTVFEDGLGISVEKAVDPREFRTGLQGALSDITRNVLTDVSFDLSFTVTEHEDLEHGGYLQYSGLLAGVRAAGGRYHQPRVYVAGGIGWYSFNYDNRPNAYVFGPYASVGAELFNRMRTMCLGVEYRAHFYFGEDSTGVPVDGGVGQASILGGFYW